MRYKDPLDKILGQKSKVKALRYLVNYNREVSIRELAREIKLVPANVSVILKELEAEGVLRSKKIGRSLVFSLNDKHYITARLIAPLFNKEKTAKQALAKVILKNIKFQFESIIIFGSVARGTEDPVSDIDLVIIIRNEKKTEEVEKFILQINPVVSEYFGNSISPIVLTVKIFVNKIKTGDPLAKSIARNGEVLAGKLISELL